MDERTKLFYTVECLLFVSGDPVPVTELARVLMLSDADTHALLSDMETLYREEGRGIQLHVTGETAQLVSSSAYVDAVETLIQPDETKNVSQSLLETLAIVAYRQPVTRADIERIRGVRCEYAVSQLQKLRLIMPVGRKDVVGRPQLFGTTDRFLHQFGLHSVEEMPEFLRYSVELPDDGEEEMQV